MVNVINVADIVNPETGNTFRQDNLAQTHKIPLETLVEILPYNEDPEQDYGEHTGLRLWVAEHTRDCDGTPLYTLSGDTVEERESKRRVAEVSTVEYGNLRVRGRIFIHAHRVTGMSEDSLKVIKFPKGTNHGG